MARTKGPRFYTTSKKAAHFTRKTLELLGEFGAKSVHAEYQDGEVSAIAFVLETAAGDVAFRMRPNIPGIRRRLQEDGVAGRPKHGAEAVAWAQLHALIELQCEAVESELVTVAEAFAGWALTSTGRTVAQMIEERAGELMPGETMLLTGGG